MKEMKVFSNQAKCILATVGCPVPEVSEYQIFESVKKLGECRTNIQRDTGRCRSVIRINSKVMNDDVSDEITLNVFVHELLHACFPEDHHRGLWAIKAAEINDNFGMHITRLADNDETAAIGLQNGSERRRANAKYAVRCVKCGKVIMRQKKTALMKNPARYRHGGGCGGDFVLCEVPVPESK